MSGLSAVAGVLAVCVASGGGVVSKDWSAFTDAVGSSYGGAPVEAVYLYESLGKVLVMAYDPEDKKWYRVYDDVLSGMDRRGGYAGKATPGKEHLNGNFENSHPSSSTLLDRYFGFVLVPGLMDHPELIDAVSFDTKRDVWIISYTAPVGRRDFALGLVPDGLKPRDVQVTVEIDGSGRMISRRYGGGEKQTYQEFRFHPDSPEGTPLPEEIGNGMAELVSFRSLNAADFDRNKVARVAVQLDTSGARGKNAPVRRIAVETGDDGRRSPAAPIPQKSGGSWWVWVVSVLIAIGVGSGLYYRFRHAG